jgi:hypothetical protein
MPKKRLIAVSDAFSDLFQGGAELSLESILEVAPDDVVRIQSSKINKDFIEKYRNDFWIFGNFYEFPRELMISFIKKNIKYSVFEYDYKYCSFRSAEIHELATGKECDCHEHRHGKEVGLFFYKSSLLWWMSEEQKHTYEEKFDFLKAHNNSEVLTSTFSERDMLFMRELNKISREKTNEYIILNSQFPIKNTAGCIDLAKKNNLKYRLVSNLKRYEMLRLLFESEGLIFLPIGKDTCPRLVIEAKLLGCRLILNNNVQHASEEWFSNDPTEIFDYLDSRKKHFWKKVEKVLND